MGKKTQNIFLTGPMGAGKTSIGRQIAKELQLNFYDSDEVIEERTKADIPWIFDLEGEEGFRKREAAVISELTKLRNIVLATGGGVIVTPENRTALSANGVVIYLKVSLNNQMQRTGQSNKRPLAKDDAMRKKTLQKLQLEHSPIYEELADIIYDSSSDSTRVRAIAFDIIDKLRAQEYI